MVALTVTMVKSEGRLVFPTDKQERSYRAYIKAMGDGEARHVTIKPIPKRQGTQSMRYYRGVVVPDIALASGVDDPDEFESVHEALAWKFLKIADHPLYGYPRRRSTAKDDLDQAEMSAYVTQCIEWGESSIPGCLVRRPDEIDDWQQVADYHWKD
jgi:hypothetical protein